MDNIVGGIQGKINDFVGGLKDAAGAIGGDINQGVVDLGNSGLGHAMVGFQQGAANLQTQVAQPMLQGFTGTMAQYSPVAHDQIQQAYQGEQGLGWGGGNNPNLTQSISQGVGSTIPMLPIAEAAGNVIGGGMKLAGIEAPTSALGKMVMGGAQAGLTGGALGAIAPIGPDGSRIQNIESNAFGFAPYGLTAGLPGGRLVQAGANALIGAGQSIGNDLLRGQPINSTSAITQGVIGAGIGFAAGAKQAFPESSPQEQQAAANLMQQRNLENGQYMAGKTTVKTRVQDWVRAETGKQPGEIVTYSDLKAAIGKYAGDQQGFIKPDEFFSKGNKQDNQQEAPTQEGDQNNGQSTNQEVNPLLPIGIQTSLHDQVGGNNAIDQTQPLSTKEQLPTQSSTSSIPPVVNAGKAEVNPQVAGKFGGPNDDALITAQAAQELERVMPQVAKNRSMMDQPAIGENTLTQDTLQAKTYRKSDLAIKNDSAKDATGTDLYEQRAAKLAESLPQDKALTGKIDQFGLDSSGNKNPIPKDQQPKGVIPPNKDEPIENIIQRHKNSVDTAQVNANQTNLNFKNTVDSLGITPKQEWALVNYSQHPNQGYLKQLMDKGYDISPQLVAKAKPLIENHIKDEAVRLQVARDAGFDVHDLPNHIRQSFLEKPEQVDEVLREKGLSMKPGFANHRAIPDYLSVEDKLTPRYTTFGQAHAQAWEELHKSIADKQLYEDLKEKRGFGPASSGPRENAPVTAERFPRDNGEVITGSKDDVKKLNNYLGVRGDNPISKLLQFSGHASERMQSLLLTTPGYTIHGFTIANMFRDLATGIGDIATLHPVRGARTIAAGPIAAVRGLIPGAAGSFEATNAKAIKEMAGEGVSYGGKLGYKNLQSNVAKPFSMDKNPLAAYNAINHALVGDPTFNKFMFQRKVSLYSNFRDSLVHQGYEYPDAVHMAAEQLKNYDGTVRSLVRSPEFKDAIKTFFFAPQYREAIMGSLTNTVKGMFDINNKSYDMSRRLAFGLTATYLAYNLLNQKNTGKNMWENGTGHEFDVAFPDPANKGKMFYIPWMPGTTTVPRMIVGTGLALAHGDTNEALKQATGVLSTPIQNLHTTLSGKNFFGQDLYDPSKPLLPQQVSQLAQQTLLPSGVNQVLTAAQLAKQGKPTNPLLTAARVFQLPIKEGTDPNTPYVQAAQARTQFEGSLAPSQLDGMKEYGDIRKQLQLNPNDIGLRETRAKLLASDPQLLANVTKEEQLMAQASHSPVTPLATYSPDQQKIILNAEALPPTDKFKKQLEADNKPLFDDYYAKDAQYSQYMAKQNMQQIPGAQAYQPGPQATPYVQAQLAAKNFKDPQVQAYLSANRQHQNDQLQQLGLNQVDKFGNIIPQAMLQQIQAGGGSAATSSISTGTGGGSSALHAMSSAKRTLKYLQKSENHAQAKAPSLRAKRMSMGTTPKKQSGKFVYNLPKPKLQAPPTFSAPKPGVRRLIARR